MTEEINRSAVMARRFELVEQIGIIEGRHKNELAPLNEELGLCEKFIHESMAAAGEQQVKIEGVGMAYFTTQDSVKVGDWDAILGYITENKAYELLNHAVNKSSIKEFIEANKAPPPGVAYESRRVLAWRRGKS